MNGSLARIWGIAAGMFGARLHGKMVMQLILRSFEASRYRIWWMQ
jgi:hypothetical protein